MKYDNNYHSVYKINYHIVFCVKYQKKSYYRQNFQKIKGDIFKNMS